MPTIAYPEYRKEDVEVTRAETVGVGREEGIVGYVGLSSFNIPESLEMQVVDPGELRVRFCYSDKERGEEEPYKIPDQPGVYLYLGKYTKKVIEIRASDAVDFLLNQQGRLSSSGIAKLAEQFPTRQQNVLTRNAEAVSLILSTMPKKLRQKVQQIVTEGRRGRQK